MVKIEQENGTLITKVEGRIDGANAREFEDAVKSAIGESSHAVIMDLEDLAYISSAGLRVILLTAKDLWKRDAKFALCSLPDPIREFVEIAGFDKIIQVYVSRAEALASLSG